MTLEVLEGEKGKEVETISPGQLSWYQWMLCTADVSTAEEK